VCEFELWPARYDRDRLRTRVERLQKRAAHMRAPRRFAQTLYIEGDYISQVRRCLDGTPPAAQVPSHPNTRRSYSNGQATASVGGRGGTRPLCYLLDSA
jgi:hypothetical protein